MHFEATNVMGVWLITPDRFDDERGFFTRTWGLDEFQAHGIDARVVQRNAAYNRMAGTLRGMHFQRAPYSEDKIISCLAGAIYDVAMDIRPESPTYGEWYGTELRADNGAILYVPKGCAHGYVTLEPETTVEYLISEYYHPEAADGIRWDDPVFNVAWPARPTIINARDRTWPDFLVTNEAVPTASSER